MKETIYVLGILTMLVIYVTNGPQSVKFKLKFFAVVLLLLNALFLSGNVLLAQYGLTLFLVLISNNTSDNDLSNKNIRGKINLYIIFLLLDFLSAALKLPQTTLIALFSLLAHTVPIIYFFQFRKFTIDITYILGIFSFNFTRIKYLVNFLME